MKASTATAIGLITLLIVIQKATAGSRLTWGVNLSGMEWAKPWQKVPVTEPRETGAWPVPTPEQLDYFASKGMTVFRVPFRWEIVQRNGLYTALSEPDIMWIDYVADQAAARGLRIIVDPHNFGRWADPATGDWDTPMTKYVVGSPEVPYDAFADFWQRLASRYANHPGIYGYGLTNEPFNMVVPGLTSEANWFNACQAAIDAIRAVDANTTIIVPGLQYSGAWCWPGRSDTLKDLVDPSGRLIYEAHQYLDYDYSGSYTQIDHPCESFGPERGSKLLARFVDWLRANGKKGIIGELNVPPTDCWMDKLDESLAYLVANKDVILSVQIYAAGPWKADTILSVEPDVDAGGNYVDKPQMAVIQNYIGR